MRSKRGLFACIAFLLALPLAALCQAVLGAGGGAVIHGALAFGSALMSFAIFDFRTPRWATWVGSASMCLLAAIFLLQGVSELAHEESLTYLAYEILGQRLEGWLVALFLAWCVALLVGERKGTTRALGIVAIATVAGTKAYDYGLAYQGSSLDARAPLLKVLWLMPFVWLLFESRKRLSRDGID